MLVDSRQFMSKQCSKCLIDKPRSDFYKSRKEADGLQYSCKDCCKKASAHWIENNPQRNKDNHTKWYYRNQDKKRAYYQQRKSSVDSP